MEKKKDNRGGKRRNQTGRPPVIKSHSEKVKKAYQDAAKKIEKETGMTVEEHFLRAAIDTDLHPGSRAAFAKLYNEALLIKETKSTIEEKKSPTIFLPERLPKPKEDEPGRDEMRVH